MRVPHAETGGPSPRGRGTKRDVFAGCEVAFASVPKEDTASAGGSQLWGSQDTGTKGTAGALLCPKATGRIGINLGALNVLDFSKLTLNSILLVTGT